MNMRKIILAGTAGLFTLGAAASATAASGTAAEGERKGEASESAAALAAAHSLSDAIRAAEAKTGGKAFSAAIEDEDEMTVYEIDAATGDKIAEVLVSAASGEVMKVEEESFVAKMMRDDEDIAALGKAKISLLDAIAAAEASAGGVAMEAELDDEDGASAAAYTIEVASADGKVAKVHVDSASGAVLKSGYAADDEDEDGDRDGDN